MISFDESPKQRMGETRNPVPARSGRPRRHDHEYRRCGTANLFVFLDARNPWRKGRLTGRRTGADFADCMRELCDVHFPDADGIRVVPDNLPAHAPAALPGAFPAAEARRILRRTGFHHAPKHAGRPGMVEIGTGVLQRRCLGRRIADRETLEAGIAAWERQRNDSQAQINRMFTTEKAREKMARAHPGPDACETSIKPSRPL